MFLRELHEDNNEFRFIPGKGRAGDPLKKISSTCLPTADTLPLLLPSNSNAKHKLDSTCLLAIGSFKFSELSLPHFAGRVSAGSPSSVDESLEGDLDLTKYLIRHPKTSYYLKVTGYSMVEAGIFHKDILVVDCALEPKDGAIVTAFINGELTVRRLHMEGTQTTLLPANPEYEAITINEETSFFIQGVVTSVIRVFKPYLR